MVDFIKIVIDADESTTFENGLIFRGSHIVNTGEIIEGVREAKYLNFRIRYLHGRIIISGSLHTFYNLITLGHHQNFNDFNFSSIIQSIKMLEEGIGFPLTKGKIVNLEFGVTIEILIIACAILKYNLISYRGKKPNQSKNSKIKGCFRRFDTSQFSIKIYDKAWQFRRHENLMRVEMKYLRSTILNKLGIREVKDLFELENLRKLSEDLLSKFNDLIIIDDPTFSSPNISEADRTLLQNIHCENFGIANTIKNCYTKRNYRKKRIYHLMEKYGLLQTKNEIYSALWEKIQNYFITKDILSFSHTM